MHHLMAVALCLFLSVGCSTNYVTGNPIWTGESTITPLAATVRVVSVTEMPPLADGTTQVMTNIGTGVLIAPTEILTVAHIIDKDARAIWVYCSMGSIHKAHVLSIDYKLDLARLSITSRHPEIIPLAAPADVWGKTVLIVGVGTAVIRTTGRIVGEDSQLYYIEGSSMEGMSGAGIFRLTADGPVLLGILTGHVDLFVVAIKLEIIREFMQ